MSDIDVDVDDSDILGDVNTLQDATSELNDEAQDMDSMLTDEIDGIMDSISGDPDEIISFVSDKNTNVTGVRFVIKTSAIKVPEAQRETQQPVEKKTFWQKLMMLLGID